MSCFLPALVLLPFLLPAQTPAPATPAPAVKAKAEKQVLRFDLRFERVESGGSDPAKAAPTAPVLLAAPILTTIDGQTASLSLTGSEPSFNISLSPAVETADNKGKKATKETLPSALVQWNLRLYGKTLPGGVATVTMTGSRRTILDKEETIASVTLSDPKTGRVTEFRLVGKVTVTSPETSTGTTP